MAKRKSKYQEEVPEEVVAKVMVRCLDCPLKAGLKDDDTYCPTCEGTGQVEKEGRE